ncbi:MAG: undecaprenyl/decaprenyl-phosphate alpha-N-acetylglucosaminyl 1-phosphate transferase [Phycisphaeraceae bacterium]|nr:undecaprenyl/decaprenyl-phosphate alpha-N-acetylglucosaminyl 1-phosphate transferase [Phycisphaeraceae bacterium]
MNTLAMLLSIPLPASDSGLDLVGVLSPYMGVFFVAFLVTFILTPVMRSLALRNGVVDWPDFKRKAHLRPVAYLGGIAIFLGWLAGMILCYYITPHDADKAAALGVFGVKFPFPIVVGAAVIALTGVIDDVYGISPRVKIGGQLFAAASLASMDVGTVLVSDSFRSLGLEFAHMDTVAYILGAALIAFFVLGGCNAVNLLDGLDGLAAGVSAITAFGLLFICAYVAMAVANYMPIGAAAAAAGSHPQAPGIDILTSPVRIVMCLAILGAVLGFLPYNFNPALIFMGDAGSLLLGYLCISTILLLAHAPGSSPALVMAALIVFAVPITDTTLAIVRRKLAGQPLFSPDKEHLHHQLRKAGLSVKQTVLALYGLALGFAAIGCSMVFLRWRFVLAFFLVLFSFVIVMAIKSAQTRILRQQLNPDEAAAAAAASADATRHPPLQPQLPPSPDDSQPAASPAPASMSDDAVMHR